MEQTTKFRLSTTGEKDISTHPATILDMYHEYI